MSEEVTANDPLVDHEFDAVVCGRYQQWLEAHHLPVPTWARLNQIAHATLDELREVARTRPPLTGPDRDALLWRHVVRYLAGEILEMVETDEQLHELQTDVLIPLELDWANDWWQRLEPVDLATAVVLALQSADD